MSDVKITFSADTNAATAAVQRFAATLQSRLQQAAGALLTVLSVRTLDNWINKRARRQVPIPPRGTLSDYVPFYFTPFSIMMFNIKTGYGSIKKRENRDIVIFVSSVHRLRDMDLPFVFTNQHAYSVDTEFFSDPEDLKRIDWLLLQSRNFKTDDDDPGKQLRYQAEALVHRHLPLSALRAICCHNSVVKQHLDGLLSDRGQQIDVKTTPTWYF